MKILYTILFTLFIGLNFTPVHALTISPAKIEISADPGQTVEGEVELFNEQNDVKTFLTSYENFESRGDSGAPYFIGAQDGLATWIDSLEKIQLQPGERVKVPYSITVPSNTKPGGYFAAFFFGTQPQSKQDSGDVSIGGKIGVLLLLRVSGDIEESAGLVDFSIKDDKRFFSQLPILFDYGFNNTGGDRIVPRGEIRIKNTLQLNSATLVANEREGSVLPGSTRRFTTAWGDISAKDQEGFFNTALYQFKNFHIGWYKAQLNIVWGESSQVATATYHFFIIPWQALIILFVVILCSWFIFKLWVTYLKRRILAEVMQQK